LIQTAVAQIRDDKPSDGGPQYGAPDSIRFRVGAEITASRGACRDIVASVAVPLECPEQTVEITEEDFSPEVGGVTYRLLQGGATQGGVRQMLISVPRLAAGATARAVIHLKVSTRTIQPPEHIDQLKIPKRIPSDLRMYTIGSPYIDIKNRSIIDLARETFTGVDESASDWEKVEAIYDRVLEKVKYVDGPDKSALEALREKQADCQGRSMLFIALCRVNKIPARMVWVQGHAYPEFYLEESDGHGWWFPCESAGTRAFGGMPLARTILQKGDNFRVPERKEHLRYASDYMVGLPAGSGGGQPTCKFIREELGR
jgi:transglutaminase-like putative cysteine protease